MPDVDRTKPLIRDRDDLKKIRTPDFDADGRFPNVVEMNRFFRKLIGGAEITIRFCAPFSFAANVRGLEQLLMDIYMDPDFVRSLFDRIIEEVLAPWVLLTSRTSQEMMPPVPFRLSTPISFGTGSSLMFCDFESFAVRKFMYPIGWVKSF